MNCIFFKMNLKLLINIFYCMMRQFCLVIRSCSFFSVQHKKVAHHTIRLHPRSRVYRVSKQTIPGHLQTHHTCDHHSRVNTCVKTTTKEFKKSKSLSHNVWHVEERSDERVGVALCDAVWVRVHPPTRIWMLSPVEGSFRWSMELNMSRAMSQMWWAWNVVLLGTPATTM